MIDPINDIRAILGEGPVWHAGQLIWVDIEGCKVHVGDATTALPERIGCAWPCADSGRLICGLESGLAYLDPHSGHLEPIANPEADLPTTRFNDGKCDPLGRFWAGTMDMEERQAVGSLYMLDQVGRLSRQWQGVTVSNGLAWGPDGATLYYIDSPTRKVVAFDYDAGAGTLSNRRTAIPIPEGEGIPDGMTIDADGMLWIALWGGWGVARYDPVTGQRLQKVDLPVEKVTSCCFGGERLDELYITTAAIGLGPGSGEAQPNAGAVFRVDAGVAGLPTVPFAGG